MFLSGSQNCGKVVPTTLCICTWFILMINLIQSNSIWQRRIYLITSTVPEGSDLLTKKYVNFEDWSRGKESNPFDSRNRPTIAIAATDRKTRMSRYFYPGVHLLNNEVTRGPHRCQRVCGRSVVNFLVFTTRGLRTNGHTCVFFLPPTLHVIVVLIYDL